MPAAVRAMVHRKSVLLVIVGLLLAACAKRSVAPVTALAKPPRTMAIGGATPPSISEAPPRTEVSRANPTPRHGKKAVAVSKREPVEKQPVGSITVAVPLDASAGRSRVDIVSAVRDALDILAKTELMFECPANMHLGSEQQLRLTARRNLNDRLKQELALRGIADSDAADIVILVTADLTSAGKDAFRITADKPGQTWDARVWRVESLLPGEHELDLAVLLSARISSGEEVQAKPIVLARSVAVGAGRFYPVRDFMNHYWPALIASLAGLVIGIWILWMLLRGHSILSHR